MDVETEGVIQFTPHAVGLEIQARNDPLQSLSDVLHRAGLEHFSVYRGYRPGKIGFLLGPVPNYHYLVQCGHILSHADIYFGTRINGNLQGLVPKESKYQYRIGGHLAQLVLTVEIGRGTVLAAHYLHRHAGQRSAGGLGNLAPQRKKTRRVEE